jgi:hypothetical protein
LGHWHREPLAPDAPVKPEPESTNAKEEAVIDKEDNDEDVKPLTRDEKKAFKAQLFRHFFSRKRVGPCGFRK